MDEAIWTRIEHLTLSKRQLTHLAMYRHPRFVSRVQMRYVYGHQYIDSLLARLNHLTDQKLHIMLNLLEQEIEYLLDKQTLIYP